MAEELTAQERLQMQSLRNVRALVDKLEAEERERKGQLLVTMIWVVGGVLLAIAILSFVARQSMATKKQARAATQQPGPLTARMTVGEFEDHVLRLIETRANALSEAPARTGREGKATIGVRIKSGGYADVETLKSSGDATVDSALLALVRRSEPFGAVPGIARPGPYPFSIDVALVPGPDGPRLTVAKSKD